MIWEIRRHHAVDPNGTVDIAVECKELDSERSRMKKKSLQNRILNHM